MTSNQPPQQPPGYNGFYLVKNQDIYEKIIDMEKYLIQLKTVVYIISFVVTPVVSTTVGVIVNNVLGD